MQPTPPNHPTTRVRSGPAHRRTHRAAAVGTVAILAIALGACGSSSGSSSGSSGTATSSPTKAAAAPNQVTLRLVAYHPGRLTVATGATVTWTQTDPGVHTVTAGTVDQGSSGVTPKPDGQFDSGEIATGKTFTHTFATPGTYHYFCRIHPATMRGVVTVR